MNTLTELDLSDIFNQEIARELMLEIEPDLTEERFRQVLDLCDGNPWNAGLLYKMTELKE